MSLFHSVLAVEGRRDGDPPRVIGLYITISDIKASISDKVNAIQGKVFRSVCFEWCLKRRGSVWASIYTLQHAMLALKVLGADMFRNRGSLNQNFVCCKY